ncbi:MAG TPA: hypothetical protein VN026_07170, partial [Bacteroidia bacterium]|nr:hypothetical protein [Bacteroidia bacterium]
MRFYSKAFLIFGTITVLFNSCKNDLKILAPYKETVSVYALLNPQENRQYIRINKIFLGEGNAYVMAQVTDSVNYKPGVLTVSLERYLYGTPVQTTVGNPTKTKIILKDTVIQLKPGPFSQDQRLWYTDDKLFAPVNDAAYGAGEYRLTITNNETGNTFTSKTLMVDSIKQPGIIQPLGFPDYQWIINNPTSTPPSWYFQDLSIPTVKRDVRFVTVKDARQYSVVMRFHYRDFYFSGDSTNMYVDYNFPTLSSQTLDGGETMVLSYYSTDLFDLVYSKINAQTPYVLKRRVIKLDFIVTAGAQ